MAGIVCCLSKMTVFAAIAFCANAVFIELAILVVDLVIGGAFAATGKIVALLVVEGYPIEDRFGLV